MTHETIPLAAGFSPATREAWLALVSKTLKGGDVESLTLRTPDGQPVQALYRGDGEAVPLPFSRPPRGGERPWDIRALVDHGDPAEANAQALEALAGGAVSLLIKLEDGLGGGARVSSADDLSRLLDSVLTDVAPVALDAGFLGTTAAGWLATAAKAAPSAPLAFHLDPLSAFARAGVSAGPIQSHMESAAALAATLADAYPKSSRFLASGTVVHEAGGAPALEIAFAMAAAVAYARAMAATGSTLQAAFGGIVIGVAVEAEPLAGIAKLRATRVVWERITTACGLESAARIEARSSRRMLTRADRWTNLVRLTAAGFAAAVGGADSIVIGAFTDGIGASDAFGQRMARNSQLILMEEAHIGKVSDPAAGSWAIEALTSDLARAAWEAFTAIEAAGGAARALEDGLVAALVAAARGGIARALAAHERRIIGVTDFAGGEAAPETDRPTGAPPATTETSRHQGLDSHCPPLVPVSLEDMAQ